MGLLDSMFGGQDDQSQQGPQSPGILGRMQAQYAPGAYAAKEQAMQQQAVYQAALQTPGMSPQIAQAMAMSPQFFQAQQGAYLPQSPQVTPVQNADGSQTLFQQNNKGGGAGHGVSISGIPITEPPGTTQNATQAAGGAGATPGAEQNENTPAASAGPTNTLQGMPGSTPAILAQIKANKAAGKDPALGIPDTYKLLSDAVLDGRETLKNITSTRGAQTANAVNQITLAREPGFDENMNEARNTYRKQYVSGKVSDIGGQVKSLNKLAGHANAMAQAATDVDNIGLGGSALAHPINELGNLIHSTPAAGLKSAADKYVAEKNTYLAGKSGGTDKGEREARREEYSGAATPQEMGTSLLSDIDFIEKQLQGNEQHRDAVFSNPKMRQQFELASPQALEQLRQAKVKAHKLVGDYDTWSQSEDGQGAQPAQEKPGLPQGWKLVK